MYKLTPRMEQHIKQDLIEYHRILGASRCSGTQLEEIIFKSIQLDHETGHHAKWNAGSHATDSDIIVVADKVEYPIQIKSGKLTVDYIKLSGYRMTKFNGDIEQITEYLNSKSSNIISVVHKLQNDDSSRHHIYQIFYIDYKYLRSLDYQKWYKINSGFKQTNTWNVEFGLFPKMSWQVWWTIPISLLDKSAEIVI